MSKGCAQLRTLDKNERAKPDRWEATFVAKMHLDASMVDVGHQRTHQEGSSGIPRTHSTATEHEKRGEGGEGARHVRPEPA